MINYYNDATIVYNCNQYSYKQINDIAEDIIKNRHIKNLPINRSKESYAAEIKVHKFLFKLGIEKERTINADLEEDISSFREALYMILNFLLGGD